MKMRVCMLLWIALLAVVSAYAQAAETSWTAEMQVKMAMVTDETLKFPMWHKGDLERVDIHGLPGMGENKKVVAITNYKAGEVVFYDPVAKEGQRMKAGNSDVNMMQRPEDVVKALKAQGIQATGPKKVGTEKVLGVECQVSEISATMPMGSLVVKVWTPRDTKKGYPAAMKTTTRVGEMVMATIEIVKLEMGAKVKDSTFEVPPDVKITDREVEEGGEG